MSSEFCQLDGTGRHRNREMTLTTFKGPDPFGPMLQISQGLGTVIGPDEPGFIQLSTLDAYRLLKVVTEWLQCEHRRRAVELQAKIEQHRELQKTIFDEAARCERFIAALEVIEIPVKLLEAA